MISIHDVYKIIKVQWFDLVSCSKRFKNLSRMQVQIRFEIFGILRSEGPVFSLGPIRRLKFLGKSGIFSLKNRNFFQINPDEASPPVHGSCDQTVKREISDEVRHLVNSVWKMSSHFLSRKKIKTQNDKTKIKNFKRWFSLTSLLP